MKQKVGAMMDLQSELKALSDFVLFHTSCESWPSRMLFGNVPVNLEEVQ